MDRRDPRESDCPDPGRVLMDHRDPRESDCPDPGRVRWITAIRGSQTAPTRGDIDGPPRPVGVRLPRPGVTLTDPRDPRGSDYPDPG